MDASLPQIMEFIASGNEFSERKLPPVAPTRGRDRKGVLYAMVDVAGSESTTLVEQVRQSLAATFYQDAGSVTSSLLRAIRRVNDTIYEENERSIRSERQYVTIVAAVVRDTDMYFAIVGPGRAYLVDDGPTERIGADDGDQAQRVGEADEVGIAMYHRGRERASILILASGDLPALLDKTLEEVPEIPAERAIPLLQFLGERGGTPFRALAVVPPELGGDGASPEAAEPPSRIERTATAISRPRLPSLRFSRPSASGSDGAKHAPSIANGTVAPPDIADQPAGTKSARVVPPPYRDTYLDEDEDGDEEEDDREEVAPRFRPRFRVPLGIYLGVAIFVLFVAGYLVARFPLGLLRNGAAYANTVTRLAQAEQEEQAGLKQNDSLAKRQHLDSARRLALEAQTLSPDNKAVATAVARIQGEYQAATGTVPLPDPVHLLDLSSQADQMEVQGLEIYLLHRQASQVDRYLLNADQTSVLKNSSPTLIRKGDRIGEATVGDLTTMAWMPAGGARDADSLVVLDRSGFLIQYDSTRGLRTLALRDPATWGHVSELGGYAGNLFALNPTDQTLAWYPPEPSGYDGDAFSYFAPTTTVTLGDAAGFLAGNDLYLVHLSGQIQKFTAGKPDKFDGPPADLAPAHPAGLDVAAGSVYIGDPQRAQILQLSTDGTYQRTLGGSHSEAILANMRDLAVSDDGKTLYVLTDHVIDRFDLTQAH